MSQKARPQPDTSTPYPSGGQVPWFDRVWASIWSGQSGASHRGVTCDKWVLSGGCGVGKLTLFPCDYISRQENGTRGEWLEFHRTRGRRSFSLVCRLIKGPGRGIGVRGCALVVHDLPRFYWLWQTMQNRQFIAKEGNYMMSAQIQFIWTCTVLSLHAGAGFFSPSNERKTLYCIVHAAISRAYSLPWQNVVEPVRVHIALGDSLLRTEVSSVPLDCTWLDCFPVAQLTRKHRCHKVILLYYINPRAGLNDD